jgi:hypothetical protein
MDINEILRQLYAERDRIDQALAALESLANSRGTRPEEIPLLKPQFPAKKLKESV